MKNNYILGGGISGITAGRVLNCPVLEQSDRIGGLCRSFRKNGFIFDCTGHYLHIPGQMEDKVLGIIDESKLRKVRKRSGIAINNRIIDYPFQSNFHKAGEEIKEECIEGFINRPKGTQVNSFRDWILKYYGEGIGKHFMFPYNEKLWQYDLQDMTIQWLGDFIPRFSEEDIIYGNNSKSSYNDYFYYPSQGGFDNILPVSDTDIVYKSRVNGIDIEKRVLYTDNREFKYKKLVSTIPLKELIAMINGSEDRLEYTSVYNINLGIRGQCPVDYHWLYFPQKQVPFYRAGIPSNVNSNMAPQGHYSLSLEIAYKNKPVLPLEEIVQSLIEYGLIKSQNDIVLRHDIDIRYAYIIYNKDWINTVNMYRDMLKSKGIYTVGRYGKWHYSFVAEDIADAIREAGELM